MQKSELELIIETIPDAVTIIDRNGNIVYANNAAERIFGLSRNEIQSRTYNAPNWRIATPDGKPFPEQDLPFNQVTKSRNPVYGIVHAIEKPDGTRIVLSINAAPLIDENGNIESVVASLTDITEQRKAAEEIRESRKQVLDILESITNAFYALDNDWRFTYVNHRAEELIGLNRVNLLFRSIWQVLTKEEFPTIFEEYHRAKERMNPIVFEEFIQRINRWFEMHVYPYQNGLSVYARDVTDRKQAEQERAASLHFFESMDRVNRAILATNDLKQMMSGVLDEVLSIFNSDRAWLNYPCDPETPVLQVPMERTKPEYPGALTLGIELIVTSDITAEMQVLLNSEGPIGYGTGNDYPLTSYVSEHFSILSMLLMAIYPKIGKPWMFGLHQCSRTRVWTQEEKRLFKEIGRRLADGLTSLLIYQELQESERKYRELFE